MRIDGKTQDDLTDGAPSRVRKAFTWSYSAIANFEACPRKHYHVSIAKDVREPMSPENAWGQNVHRGIYHRIVDGTELGTPYKHLEPLVAKVINAPGITYAEQRLAINQDFEPVDFWAKDVWMRTVVDVMKVRPDGSVWIGDWKTGKFKDDPLQLAVMAGATIATQPTVDEITASFIWLKETKVTTVKFTRADLGAAWNEILPRVKRYEAAYMADSWPARPSGLCRRHCSVSSCPHHGGR